MRIFLILVIFIAIDFAFGNSSLLQKSIKLYQIELQKEPNNIEIKKRLSLAYFLNKNYKEAIKLYQELLDITKDSNYYEKIALAYLRWGKIQEATKYYFKSLNIAKDKFLKSKEYGNILFQAGYSKEAKEFYLEALKIKEEIFLYLQLGYCNNDIANYKEAIEDFKKALRLNPKSADAIGGLAFAYFLSGDKENTIKTLKKIEKDFKNSEELYSTVSFIYDKLNMFKEAERVAKESIKRFKSKKAYSDLVTIYLHSKRYKEALMFMGELSFKDYNINAYIYHFMRKEFKQARRYLNNLIKINPKVFLNYVNLMEFELVSEGKIKEDTKKRANELIQRQGQRVQYDMILLLESISKGKKVDLNYLKEWKKEHINGYSEIIFWNFDEVKKWENSFKDSNIKKYLNLAINFLEGKVE